MTNWKEVHSSSEERPSELDTTTSQAVVYERKNIRQDDEEWVYDERIYSKEEYQNLVSPAAQLIMQNISDLECEIAALG